MSNNGFGLFPVGSAYTRGTNLGQLDQGLSLGSQVNYPDDLLYDINPTADITDISRLGAYGGELLGGGGGGSGNGYSTFKNFGIGAQGVGNLVQAYTGLQQLKLAKKAYNLQKGTTNRNLANQAKSINSELAGRQDARITNAALNGRAGSRQSTASFLKEYGVDGSPVG